MLTFAVYSAYYPHDLPRKVIFCVYGCFASLYAMHELLLLVETKRWYQIPWTGIIDRCELPVVAWNQTPVLWKSSQVFNHGGVSLVLTPWTLTCVGRLKEVSLCSQDCKVTRWWSYCRAETACLVAVGFVAELLAILSPSRMPMNPQAWVRWCWRWDAPRLCASRRLLWQWVTSAGQFSHIVI